MLCALENMTHCLGGEDVCKFSTDRSCRKVFFEFLTDKGWKDIFQVSLVAQAEEMSANFPRITRKQSLERKDSFDVRLLSQEGNAFSKSNNF